MFFNTDPRPQGGREQADRFRMRPGLVAPVQVPRAQPPLRTARMRSRVFLSYHYNWDQDRANAVRQVIGNSAAPALSDHNWQELVQEGDHAVARWFAQQLDKSQCTIVLISPSTRGRRVIDHEIYQSWKAKRGVLGIYVHHLLDRSGHQTTRGPNPFAEFELARDRCRLSDVVRTYDPPFVEPRGVLNYIADNVAGWVQEAISIRRNY